MIGITAYGGYIPRLRLPRDEIAKANGWLNPSLRGQAKGSRSLGGWDEDSVTFAVEASRDALSGTDGADLDAVYLASLSLPFADRLNASIVAGALDLDQSLAAFDLGSSQRVGLSALSSALSGVKAGVHQRALVAVAERRSGPIGSVAEISRGDGAAALLISDQEVIAEYLGGVVHTVDFVDHYRSNGSYYDYEWEERWVRDEGYAKLVPPVLEQLLEQSGVQGADIAHFVFPAPKGVAAGLAKKLGIQATALADDLYAEVGDTGAAHPLIILAHLLERAQPGQLIVLAGFGQGCEALLFRTTEQITKVHPRRGVSGWLAVGVEERQYTKLPVFNRTFVYEKGMRAEFDRKAILSLMYRKRDFLEGFVGGRCVQCGTVQIPRSRSCVGCGAIDTQAPQKFSDSTGTVLSWSADYLAYTVDPPHHIGMVQFDIGGRLMMDFTDVKPGDVDTGTKVRVVFRIKDFDDQRSFRRYFWKAVPLLD